MDPKIKEYLLQKMMEKNPALNEELALKQSQRDEAVQSNNRGAALSRAFNFGRGGDANQGYYNQLNKQAENEVGEHLAKVKMQEAIQSKAAGQKIQSDESEARRSETKTHRSQMRGDRLDKLKEVRTQSFRDKLQQAPAYKDYALTKSNMANLEYAVKNPGAFGDLGMLFDYMKALDPGSVVREGEQQMFASSGSISERMANMLNKVVAGETLQPAQREEILRFANQRVKASQSRYSTHLGPIIKQASKLGLNEREIDPFYGGNKVKDKPVIKNGKEVPKWAE